MDVKISTLSGISSVIPACRFFSASSCSGKGSANISFTSDIVASLWGVVGYTVLLVFTLFKTGGLARSVLNAH